jgi:hypothetical protein
MVGGISFLDKIPLEVWTILGASLIGVSTWVGFLLKERRNRPLLKVLAQLKENLHPNQRTIDLHVKNLSNVPIEVEEIILRFEGWGQKQLNASGMAESMVRANDERQIMTHDAIYSNLVLLGRVANGGEWAGLIGVRVVYSAVGHKKAMKTLWSCYMVSVRPFDSTYFDKRECEAGIRSLWRRIRGRGIRFFDIFDDKP